MARSRILRSLSATRSSMRCRGVWRGASAKYGCRAAAAAVVRRTLRRVCVGQLRATSDHDSNLAAAATLCADAARAGACLLCLPEAFSFIGSAAAETVAQATALDGPRLEK